MKIDDIELCDFIVTNDETEIFAELAIENFKNHVVVMAQCMGDDYKRHLYDRKYIEEVFNKVIERTKEDFNKAMKDDSRIEYILFMDGVKDKLEYIYSLYCVHL
ncbi:MULTISPECIES: hypothetical protein [Klebsiella]|uniref:hypothetical protein n=1 Tax=Klebsiella TaxID=570 RepID=UPI00109D3A91|nr:hypothetical protein [Klebsiella quasipneumoniae]EJX2758219.1 hypothetical protein [Salmonella enterica]HBW3123418.1 hypothetical protein [Klebsiella pneumoniae]EJX2849507.1 hypothetical protein [Salmonella enterica]UDC56643.1 hypothetical protein LGM24_09135 [Klebsiella quasipneumoniae subsp. quasipneumoniae]VGO92502.1 hypothetical protein SB02110_01230 [Klebsiella quasipneumoniae subsp. quasipneumoniae]